jgi:hypothetical protein
MSPIRRLVRRKAAAIDIAGQEVGVREMPLGSNASVLAYLSNRGGLRHGRVKKGESLQSQQIRSV